MTELPLPEDAHDMAANSTDPGASSSLAVQLSLKKVPGVSTVLVEQADKLEEQEVGERERNSLDVPRMSMNSSLCRLSRAQ